MASPADLGFTLVPADPGIISADLALEAALAPVVDLEPPTPEPLGRGWAFDFVAGEFVNSNGAPAGVSEVDHLRVWIEKTLRTANQAHPIYSDVYGIEDPFSPMGEVATSEVLALYQQDTVDALVVHDRIAAVGNFHFQSDPSSEQLYVSFEVTLDDPNVEPIQITSLPVGGGA